MTGWADAVLAARLFAVDPSGVSVRSPAGMLRDRWLAVLRDALPAEVPVRRVPLNIADDRLLGGIDLAATLRAGRPVQSRGVLAEGGVLLLAMAERLPVGRAAQMSAALDAGGRFGLIALDEGADADERPPAGLLDRLAILLDLSGVHEPADEPAPADIGHARRVVSSVEAPETVVAALCATAAALGVHSMRAPALALRVARAAAALAGRDRVEPDDVALACRLVLAPRATQLPEAEAEDDTGEAEHEQHTAPDPDTNPDARDKPLEDRVIEAARAAIPPGLLARLQDHAAQRTRARTAGTAGALQRSGQRGRPAGVRQGDLRRGLRLNLIETLRAAAPWQALRRGPGQTRIVVHPADIRVTHLKQRTATTTIFVVDASGSAALARLAEAKGAVELLLAECYVRRDQVAVLAFRGRAAQLLLPPTRSLVRAKRSLAGLPGGGGTPLAAGIDAGAALAADVRRRGGSPTLVLLTDGRANVARDGKGNRARAEEEALGAARQLRAAGVRAMLVDTSSRPHAPNERLAMQMGARYLPLPYADAASLSRAVQANR